MKPTDIITTKSGLTATLYCADALNTVGNLRGTVGVTISCIITDPPYSDKTHSGHDAACAVTRRDGARRQSLNYAAWTRDDARTAVAELSRSTDGWVVLMTDHTLAPAIGNAFRRAGRYVFAPLPFFAPGSRCRLTGDGPSSWTDWIIVARTAAQLRWGTLPGGYVQGKGWDDKERMGGKPTLLMQALVGDYSRRGDTVCDPYMGAGTTGVACLREGRNFIGVEIDAAAYAIAKRRISAEAAQGKLFT